MKSSNGRDPNSSDGRHPEDESTGLQTVISRSFLYVYFPLLIVIFLAINFVWEVIRENVDPATAESWPLRFSLMGLPTTAALLGVSGTLLLGRMQWAHANRPALGSAIDDKDAAFQPDSKEWRVWLYNAGPGVAQVARFRYIVKFVNGIGSRPATLTEINRALKERGLIDGEDYFIRWLSKGFPFPPTNQYHKGMQIARFSVEALAQFEQLDIEVTVTDGVGDTHERSVLIIDRLPSVAKSAVERVRNVRRSSQP